MIGGLVGVVGVDGEGLPLLSCPDLHRVLSDVPSSPNQSEQMGSPDTGVPHLPAVCGRPPPVTLTTWSEVVGRRCEDVYIYRELPS